MHSFHLFLFSSESTRSLPFLSFIISIFGPNVPLIFPISLKTSLVFPLLLFSSSFIHYSLKKAFLLLHAVLWKSVFSWIYLSLSPLLFTSLLSSSVCKASSDNHFAFLLFFFLEWFCSLPPVQYYVPPSIVLQAHCLLDLIPWICSSPPLHIHKEFRSYLAYLVVSPTLFS